MFVASKVTSNGTGPKASRTRRGKAFMARAKARPPRSSSSSDPQAIPLSIPRVKPPGRPLRLPLLRLELVGTRPPQKRWLREPNMLRLRRLRRRMTTMCKFACHGRRWRQWMPSEPSRCSNLFPRALGRKIPTSPSISSGAAAGTRVAAVAWRFQHHFVFACFGLAV